MSIQSLSLNSALCNRDPESRQVNAIYLFMPGEGNEFKIIDHEGNVLQCPSVQAHELWSELVQRGWSHISFDYASTLRTQLFTRLLASKSAAKAASLSRNQSPMRQESSRDVRRTPIETKHYRHVDNNWDPQAIETKPYRHVDDNWDPQAIK